MAVIFHNRLLWLLTLLLLLAFSFTAHGAKPNISSQLQGVVMPAKTVKLSFAESGIVRELVANGTIVQSGEQVAKLDDKKNRALLQQSQAQLRAAQSELKSSIHSRDKSARLVADNILSDIALTEAEFAVVLAQENLAVAQAKLRVAKTALEDRTVTAPFTGAVIMTNVNKGEWAKPGEPFLELVVLNDLRLSTDLSPDLVSDLPIDHTTDVMSQKQIVGQATVKTIFPVINPASGLQRVIWQVSAKPGFLLSGRHVFLSHWRNKQFPNTAKDKQ